MADGGYIKLFRSMTDWEYYKNTNVKALFLHLLLMSSPKDWEYDGLTIRRGQLFTSLKRLENETGMSRQNVRTALKHLVLTHSLTYQPTHTLTHQGILVNICKYDDYQATFFEPNTPSNTQTNTGSNTYIRRDKEIYNNNGGSPENYGNLIRNNEAQIAAFAKAHNKPRDEILRLLGEFETHCAAIGKPPQGAYEWAKHFDSWLKKQDRQTKPKNISNEQSNRNYQKHGRRPSADNVAVCEGLPPATRLVPRSRVISGKTPRLGPDKRSD